MSKIRAFSLHFCISAIIVGSALAIIFMVWYPHPYFQIGEAWGVIGVLVGVDLIVGPFLTLIVYKKNKPRLRFDMTVIAFIQIVALTYGTYTIYSERPHYLIFAVDRFTLLTQSDLEHHAFAKSDWRRKPLIGPLVAVAEYPKDVAAQQALLFELLSGAPDIELRPETWRPLAEHKDEVLARAEPISTLAEADGDAARQVSRLAAKYGISPENLMYVPAIAKTYKGLALILDPATARPMDVIDIDPWTIDRRVTSATD